MTQRSSSRDWTLPVMLWAFLSACIWTGCGLNDLTVSLPSSYHLILEGDRGAWVTDAGDHEIEELDVIELEWDLSYVYGRSKPRPPFGNQYHWFILDTSNGTLNGFVSRQDWEKQLDRLYLFNDNLKDISQLRKETMILYSFLIMLALIWFSACGLLLRKRRRKQPGATP